MTSKLINKPPYEIENAFAQSLHESYLLSQPELRPPFPLTTPTPSHYQTLTRGILYAMLSEPHCAHLHIKHLHGIVTDGYALFITLVTNLVNEMYSKLVENVRVGIMWIVSEMIDVSGSGVDGLVVALLRQTRGGGDLSDGNLWLCLELLNVLLRKWECLVDEDEGLTFVVTSGLYVFLRLLGDHCRVSGNSKLDFLKQREIEFCVRVFREEFRFCLRIGRDLIRVLQDLVHVDVFRDIWKDLLLAPSNFKTCGFSDISKLYKTRTSSKYFLLRITPEMETHLRFLLTEVKLGSQSRYQIWFGRKFLNVLENESVVIDIVRFICCGHHPTNKIIFSDVTPRWAVIGWLLKCCSKYHILANVKLALFFDWLFFHEEVDNIMNIEPAILLMINSIPKYIDITHNLLEFLFLLMDHYDIERKDLVIRGISLAFDVLEKRGVVQSFDALTSCDMLSPFLKEKLVKLLSCRNLSVGDQVQNVFLPCQISQSLKS